MIGNKHPNLFWKSFAKCSPDFVCLSHKLFSCLSPILFQAISFIRGIVKLMLGIGEILARLRRGFGISLAILRRRFGDTFVSFLAFVLFFPTLCVGLVRIVDGPAPHPPRLPAIPLPTPSSLPLPLPFAAPRPASLYIQVDLQGRVCPQPLLQKKYM